MASATKSRLFPAEPPRKSGRGRAALGAVGLALVAAAATGVALPRATYTAAAVVGVEGGPASLRPALIQAAADAVRSRQVAARAASAFSGKAAVRAETLAAAVGVDAGRVPGTLILRVDDGDAERAAALASALASALVAELEDRSQATRRDGDAADALRLSRLQQAAAEAHGKLIALGGDSADPSAGRTAAMARAEALRARLDAIRSILAAGTPPLGAGRDVPPNIEALQTGYLDLTRQLAKARETLGERHTTVVGLQEAIRRSAAELTAGWTRLAKLTEQDFADAKARATASVKGGLDASRAAALDAARAAVRVADDALARASTPRDGEDQPRWHLVARASVPALAEGLGLPIRLAVAVAVGLLALLFGFRSLRPRNKGVATETAPATVIEPTFFDDEALVHETLFEETPVEETLVEETPEPEPMPVPRRAEPVRAAPRPKPVRAAPRPQPVRAPAPAASRDELELDAMLRETHPMYPTAADLHLVAAASHVLPAIDAVVPRAGIPFVLVATNEDGVDTMETVLALAAAAAEQGRRVLIVEGARARPALAAAVDPDAAPALVDVLGDIRIVLRAEAGAGQVYLAPAFRHGTRIAADLARAGTALVADDLADEFDLVVLDGGQTSDAVALADEADTVLSVGRFASPRDAAHFLATLGVPEGAFLGTVAASAFVPHAVPRRPASRPAEEPRSAPRAVFASHPLRRPAPADARRRVGAR